MIFFESGYWTVRKKWNLFVGKEHMTISQARNFCESNKGRLPCPERTELITNIYQLKQELIFIPFIFGTSGDHLSVQTLVIIVYFATC